MTDRPTSTAPVGAGARPRWGRVLLLLLLLFAGLETASRVAVRAWIGRPFRSFDPYALSGYGVYRSNPDYTHPQFRHDSAGFRNDREFSVDKPEGTFRVMLIGASVLYAGSAVTAEGFSLRIGTDETISAYLQPLLAELPELQGRDVEVINAGVNRHYLRQTISYYVAELARYDPDVVVVFGTHNDSARIEQIDGRSTMFHDPAAPTPEERRVELLLNEATLEGVAEKLVRTAVNRSACAAIVYRIQDRLLQRIARTANVHRRENPQVGTLASPAQRERQMRDYLAGLDALLSYIEGQGARPAVYWEYLLLLVQDLKPLTPHERAQVEFLERHAGAFSEEQKRLKFATRDRVAEHLTSRGVPFIDPLDDMRHYSGELYNDYLHYNAEGNRWVAGLVARDLRRVIRQALDDS